MIKKMTQRQTLVDNLNRLRELSQVARNLRYLHIEIISGLNQISSTSKQDFTQINRNMTLLRLSLEAMERNLSALPAVIGNLKEINELNEDFVYDLANAVTVTQLLEYVSHYSPEFWQEAFGDVDLGILKEAIEKQSPDRKATLISVLTS